MKVLSQRDYNEWADNGAPGAGPKALTTEDGAIDGIGGELYVNPRIANESPISKNNGETLQPLWELLKAWDEPWNK